MKTDYLGQLSDKERLYQIVVSELQENKMFWSVKVDEKNKDIHGLKKSMDHLKEENRRIRSETEVLRGKAREKEEY